MWYMDCKIIRDEVGFGRNTKKKKATLYAYFQKKKKNRSCQVNFLICITEFYVFKQLLFYIFIGLGL